MERAFSGKPRALARAALSGAAAVSVCVALLLGSRFSWRFAALSGWDCGALVMLLLAWRIILTSGAPTTRTRAAADDPGRTAVYVLVLLTSGSSLLATAALVHRAQSMPGGEGDALVLLSIANVTLCWALTQTAFALRYAHLYYRGDAAGGIEFPGGKPPAYLDFAYFAFTVGMTFQVSDTAVSIALIRHTVLLHGVLSFIYNTAIIAFVLNVIFNFAGGSR